MELEQKQRAVLKGFVYYTVKIMDSFQGSDIIHFTLRKITVGADPTPSYYVLSTLTFLLGETSLAYVLLALCTSPSEYML